MTDIRDAVVGSYDDVPESEVSTVLEVPLLWHQQQGAQTPDPSHQTSSSAGRPARHRSGGSRSGTATGRHRAGSDGGVSVAPRPTQTVVPARPTSRGSTRRSGSGTVESDALVHTLQVGLVSAALVLLACAAVLLAIARWLP